MTRAAVLGSGSWGTVFGKVLADAGARVRVLARAREVVDSINDDRENARYMPGVRLPDLLTATSDVDAALDGARVVVLAVPSQSLRANLGAWAARIEPGALLVSLMKGVELGTTKRMSEVIAEVAGVAPERIAVVSGPNLAKEIALEHPAATVVASVSAEAALIVQGACSTPYFRPYTNPDVVGCELGGAVKNVIALAAGMAEGMGFGDNTKASLITRGLAETARLGAALGADPMTFAGLAGMGDLVVTCGSPLSRNRTFGEKLGRGMTVDAVAAEQRQVAEGVKSCRSILDLARNHGVDMPITEHVHMCIYEGWSPQQVLKSLMSRDTKPE